MLGGGEGGEEQKERSDEKRTQRWWGMVSAVNGSPAPRDTRNTSTRRVEALTRQGIPVRSTVIGPYAA